MLMTVFGIRHTYPLLTTTETHLKLKCPEATDGFVYADKRILKEQDHKIITHFWGICKFFRLNEKSFITITSNYIQHLQRDNIDDEN